MSDDKIKIYTIRKSELFRNRVQKILLSNSILLLNEEDDLTIDSSFKGN